MVAVWLKLDLPEPVIKDIASIQDPVRRYSWVDVRIQAGNLRDVRTSEPDEERPGERIEPEESNW